MRKEAVVGTLIAVLAAGASTLFGAAITPGNLVIYRVDNGNTALGTTATSVILDEYTVGGVLVQSIPLDSTGASALTAVGNATTEGIISRSQDGSKLVFTGYRKNAGGTNPSGDAVTTTPRLIGTIGLSGVVDTSIGLTDSGTNTIRSATTVDGTSYYVSTSAAVRYVASPGAASTSVVLDARNSRQVNLFNNELLASNGSTAVTAKVQSYGPLPTGATPPTPVVSLLSTDAVNGFVALDLNPAVAGTDTIYELCTTQSQLQKWIFDGTAWSQAGSVAAGASQNVTTIVHDNGDVSLYITSPTALLTLLDSAGPTGTLAGSTTTLATLTGNTAFRGVGVVPEPATMALLSLAGLALAGRRRR